MLQLGKHEQNVYSAFPPLIQAIEVIFESLNLRPTTISALKRLKLIF